MRQKYEDFNPEDWQERHSPTVNATIKNGDGSIIGVCRRRVKDSKVWDKIESNHLEREAIRVCRAYHFITFGRGCRTSKLVESIDRSGLELFLNDLDFLYYLMRCKKDYIRWAEKCRAHKVSREAVIDLLYFNVTAAEIESKYKKRHGWAMRNMVKALQLYI